MNIYPEVLLSASEMTVLAGVLNGASAVLRESFPVTRIVLGKAQECIDCLLVVLVALDLDYHLLQPEDNLVAALLRHLVIHEVPRALLMFPRPLLVLLRGILRHTVPQVPGAIELVLCSTVCHDMWITGAIGVDMGSRVLLDLAEVAAVERLILVELLAELTLDVFAREVRRVVPLVVGRRLVDLSECLFIWADFRGSLGGRVTGNIAEDGDGVAEEFPELAVGVSRVQQCLFLSNHEMSLDGLPIGDDQLSKASQTSFGFLRVAASAVAGYRYSRGSGLRTTFSAKLGRIPDKLLQGLVIVLGEEETLGFIDDIAEVLKDCLAFVGEVPVGVGQFRVVGEGGESGIDLGVGGEFASGETCWRERG